SVIVWVPARNAGPMSPTPANPEKGPTGLAEDSGLTRFIAEGGDRGGEPLDVHPLRRVRALLKIGIRDHCTDLLRSRLLRLPQHRRAERQEILRSDAVAARCREVSLQLRSCFRRGGRE